MSQSRDLRCTDHGDQAVCLCEKCNIPVCISCVTGNHQDHKMVDFAKVLQKEKKMLQNDINRIQHGILPTLFKWKRDLDSNKANIDIKIQQITKDMESENQCIQNEINKTHCERIQYLDSIYQSKSAFFDGSFQSINTKISFYEGKLSEYKHAVENEILPKIIEITRRNESFKSFGSKPKLQDPPVFEPGSIRSIRQSLGKLHGSPEFHGYGSPPWYFSLLVCAFLVIVLAFVGSYARSTSSPAPEAHSLILTTPTIESKFRPTLNGWTSLLVTKRGDVWLGAAHSSELVMVDIKGQIFKRKKVKSKPTALAVMDNGDIIISPSPFSGFRSVARLWKDDKETVVFHTDTPFRGNFGVYVTTSQKILFCTHDGRVVLANSDGGDIEQIYKGCGEFSVIHAVESTNGNIYISDWIASAVVIVNKDGQVLVTLTHTTDGRKLGSPTGLVVDMLGNVLCADFYHHIIYIIDQTGYMRELVGHSYGIRNPLWLAVDSKNYLWITQEDGTVHVVKYIS